MAKSPHCPIESGLLVLLLAFAGCGENRTPVAPVRGVITLDGQPLSGAAITLNPVDGGRPGSAVSDSQGVFEISTFDPGDGAVLGEHVVTVTLEEQTAIGGDKNALDEAIGSQGIVIESLVPEIYTRRKTSPLRVNVTEESAEVKLELTTSAASTR